MLLFLILFSLSVSARVWNITIDDTLGDEYTGQVPQYAPDDWRARSVGAVPCKTCKAKPDGTYVYRGTWHDRSTGTGQAPSTIYMSFTGTRIYVFFILFNDIGTFSPNTRLRFYLDGYPDITKDFLHIGDPAGEKYLYNQLVFDSRPLELATHSLRISSYSNGSDGSVALFDYAIYTTRGDDEPTGKIAQSPISSPSSQSGTHTGSPPPPSGHSPPVRVVVACSIVGTLIALALSITGGYWIYTRMHRRRGTIRPFDAHLRPHSPIRQERQKAGKALLSSETPPQLIDIPAQVSSELGRLREELERVRRITEPPEYPARRHSETADTG